MIEVLRYYPEIRKYKSDLNRVSGTRTGILNQSQYFVYNHMQDVHLKSITGDLPSYHNQFIAENAEVSYHIMGYGLSYEESLPRYLGESIERYAAVTGHKLLEEDVVFASYNELEKKAKVIPFEYIQVFSDSQMKNESYFRDYLQIDQLTKDDVLGWIKCPSMFGDTDIYVPAQMFFVGYVPNKIHKEKGYRIGFSTGTAAHRYKEKALYNAVIEYLQIDSFILSWYTKKKCKRVIIDDVEIKEILDRCNLGDSSLYEVIVIDMSIDESSPIRTFGTILKNKELEGPYLLFGVQGGLDPKQTIIRSIMEAAAISYGYYYNVLYETVEKESEFYDLDSNVVFYSYPTNVHEKWKVFSELIGSTKMLSEYENNSTKDIKLDLQKVLSYVKTVSPLATYYDITPPELASLDWYVFRVFMPECLEMCLPSVPYANHPRMKQFGGVSNDNPHPMP